VTDGHAKWSDSNPGPAAIAKQMDVIDLTDPLATDFGTWADDLRAAALLEPDDATAARHISAMVARAERRPIGSDGQRGSRAVAAAAVAGVIFVGGVGLAAAATGRLPGPLQRLAMAAARPFGVHLDSSDHPPGAARPHRPGPSSPPPRTPGSASTRLYHAGVGEQTGGDNNIGGSTASTVPVSGRSTAPGQTGADPGRSATAPGHSGSTNNRPSVPPGRPVTLPPPSGHGHTPVTTSTGNGTTTTSSPKKGHQGSDGS
jgi:hypothetical protein